MLKQISPEVVGDFERLFALGFREEISDDPLDLLKGLEADRFSRHFDPIKDILPTFCQRDVDAGNLLDMKR